MRSGWLWLCVVLWVLMGVEAGGVEGSVRWGRQEVVNRAIGGFWKLLDDSNFRINSKLTMINEQSDRKKRISSMVNFLLKTDGVRQAEGFFQAQKEGNPASSLYLKLYDGKYNQNDTIILQIDLQETLPKNLQTDGKVVLWSNSKAKFVTCLLLRNREIIGKFSASANVEVSTSLQDQQTLNGNSKIEIKFQSTTLSFKAYMNPIQNEFTPFVRVVQVCTVLFVLAVMCFKAKKSVYNLSEWMIVQVAAFVVAANIIFLHESLTKLDTNLKMVGVCALVNITISLLFLRKYESVVFNEFNNKKRGIALAIFLVVYFSLVYIYQRNMVFWIYEGFFLLAVQVNYAYSVGGKGGMSIALLFTIIFSRVPFVYYRYYLQGLTREPNNARLLIVFIGITIILLGFITLQRYFGSRFIIPNELIPDYFNYYKKVDKNEKSLEQDCSICTVALKENPDINAPEDQFKLEEPSDAGVGKPKGATELESQLEKLNFVTLMVTPCEHEFHPSCLQDWMDKRLNCPICRGQLPPSEQQRDDSYCC